MERGRVKRRRVSQGTKKGSFIKTSTMLGANRGEIKLVSYIQSENENN